MGAGGLAHGRPPRVVCISGASGAGKTRLIVRLVPVLAARGLRVAVVKHTRHAHPLDVRGKDTERFRRAGALASGITGPGGTALFGPPARTLADLVRRLPPVDLVLAEGFRGAAVPRIEVHRRSVSRRFLCAGDRRVFAVVGDGAPPRRLPVVDPDDVERVAELLCRRLGILAQASLRVRGPVRSLLAGRSERMVRQVRDAVHAPWRAKMAKTTSRRKGARRTTGSRSEAGRKGGRATLRARGPEFFSEIGRKGGKSRSRKAAARAGRRSATASSGKTGRRRGSTAASRRRSR